MLLNRPVNLPQNEILTAGESGDYTDMHRHGAALAELEQSPEQQLLAVQAVRKIPEQAAAVGTASVSSTGSCGGRYRSESVMQIMPA